MLIFVEKMTVETRMDDPRDKFPVGMRVLAVDDDPTCLMVLETLLRRCQYHGLFLLLLVFPSLSCEIAGLGFRICDLFITFWDSLYVSNFL